MESTATPVSAKERIYTLDVIRGFALLGIFIMNMPWFNTSFYVEYAGTELWPEWWDKWTETATEVLFAGKFNSMFSMLFAIGFTIQLERLEARDPGHAKAIYLRRIFWLFVFGVIHVCVFWTGDVLHVYALMGLLLLALRRAPYKVLWTLFALCLLFPVAMGIYRYFTFTPADGEYIVAVSKAWEASNNAAYGHGSFYAAAREHTLEFGMLYTEPFMLRGTLSFYSQILVTMFLGLMLGRARFFQNSSNYLPQVKRLQWWALGCGLAAGAIYRRMVGDHHGLRNADAVAHHRAHLLHPVPCTDHGVLRRDAGALRAQRDLAAPPAAHGHRRAHAAHQLPHADIDRDHVVLRLGIRPVGQGRQRTRPGAGHWHLLPGAGAAEQVVAGET